MLKAKKLCRCISGRSRFDGYARSNCQADQDLPGTQVWPARSGQGWSGEGGRGDFCFDQANTDGIGQFDFPEKPVSKSRQGSQLRQTEAPTAKSAWVIPKSIQVRRLRDSSPRVSVLVRRMPTTQPHHSSAATPSIRGSAKRMGVREAVFYDRILRPLQV